MKSGPAAASVLPRAFYARGPLVVAPALLGKKLVRRYRGKILSGEIVEVEAYGGRSDSASHAYRGRTPRTATMFGPPGHAYVYFVYGMHRCLNVVTGSEGYASAVLIRALRPLAGVETMRRLRQGREPLTAGPGRLCQALAIGLEFDGRDLTAGGALWLEPYRKVPRAAISSSPRVGIAYACAEDRTAEWRFSLCGIDRRENRPGGKPRI